MGANRKEGGGLAATEEDLLAYLSERENKEIRPDELRVIPKLKLPGDMKESERLRLLRENHPSRYSQ